MTVSLYKEGKIEGMRTCAGAQVYRVAINSMLRVRTVMCVFRSAGARVEAAVALC